MVDAALAAGVGPARSRSRSASPTRTAATHGSTSPCPIEPPPGIDAVAVAEGQRGPVHRRRDGLGVVLRFGLFYGPGSAHTEEFIRAGPPPPRPGGRARRAATSRRSTWPTPPPPSSPRSRAPAGIYNVVDDEPLTKKEYARAVGAAVGTKPWVDLPGRIARVGGKKSEVLTRSQRVSNAKFKAGDRLVAPRTRRPARVRYGDHGAGRCVTRYTTVLLAVIAIGYAGVGAWAALAPRSFYDDFPGGGRHWVAVDGPFNEHLVRDVGTLNLALAAVDRRRAGAAGPLSGARSSPGPRWSMPLRTSCTTCSIWTCSTPGTRSAEVGIARHHRDRPGPAAASTAWRTGTHSDTPPLKRRAR